MTLAASAFLLGTLSGTSYAVPRKLCPYAIQLFNQKVESIGNRKYKNPKTPRVVYYNMDLVFKLKAYANYRCSYAVQGLGTPQRYLLNGKRVGRPGYRRQLSGQATLSKGAQNAQLSFYVTDAFGVRKDEEAFYKAGYKTAGLNLKKKETRGHLRGFSYEHLYREVRTTVTGTHRFEYQLLR